MGSMPRFALQMQSSSSGTETMLSTIMFGLSITWNMLPMRSSSPTLSHSFKMLGELQRWEGRCFQVRDEVKEGDIAGIFPQTFSTSVMSPSQHANVFISVNSGSLLVSEGYIVRASSERLPFQQNPPRIAKTQVQGIVLLSACIGENTFLFPRLCILTFGEGQWGS